MCTAMVEASERISGTFTGRALIDCVLVEENLRALPQKNRKECDVYFSRKPNVKRSRKSREPKKNRSILANILTQEESEEVGSSTDDNLPVVDELSVRMAAIKKTLEIMRIQKARSEDDQADSVFVRTPFKTERKPPKHSDQREADGNFVLIPFKAENKASKRSEKLIYVPPPMRLRKNAPDRGETKCSGTKSGNENPTPPTEGDENPLPPTKSGRHIRWGGPTIMVPKKSLAKETIAFKVAAPSILKKSNDKKLIATENEVKEEGIEEEKDYTYVPVFDENDFEHFLLPDPAEASQLTTEVKLATSQNKHEKVEPGEMEDEDDVSVFERGDLFPAHEIAPLSPTPEPAQVLDVFQGLEQRDLVEIQNSSSSETLCKLLKLLLTLHRTGNGSQVSTTNLNTSSELCGAHLHVLQEQYPSTRTGPQPVTHKPAVLQPSHFQPFVYGSQTLMDARFGSSFPEHINPSQQPQPLVMHPVGNNQSFTEHTVQPEAQLSAQPPQYSAMRPLRAYPPFDQLGPSQLAKQQAFPLEMPQPPSRHLLEPTQLFDEQAAKSQPQSGVFRGNAPQCPVFHPKGTYHSFEQYDGERPSQPTLHRNSAHRQGLHSSKTIQSFEEQIAKCPPQSAMSPVNAPRPPLGTYRAFDQHIGEYQSQPTWHLAALSNSAPQQGPDSPGTNRPFDEHVAQLFPPSATQDRMKLRHLLGPYPSFDELSAKSPPQSGVSPVNSSQPPVIHPMGTYRPYNEVFRELASQPAPQLASLLNLAQLQGLNPSRNNSPNAVQRLSPPATLDQIDSSLFIEHGRKKCTIFDEDAIPLSESYFNIQRPCDVEPTGSSRSVLLTDNLLHGVSLEETPAYNFRNFRISECNPPPGFDPIYVPFK